MTSHSPKSPNFILYYRHQKMIRSNLFVVVLFAIVTIVVAMEVCNNKNETVPGIVTETADSTWVAPSLYTDAATTGKQRAMIIYGEDLIANTSKYLGPHGSVMQISNGMNCQNCHLDAGKQPWGNNYGGVYSTYPKFRARSGTVENIYKRVNDCLERSLNGQALDTNSYEMQSISAYMKWLGTDVPKDKKPYSAGLPPLPYLNRAADPQKGRLVYNNSCLSCHGKNGEGLSNTDGVGYTYPPLWGDKSYNDGAGLFRLSRFASFVKNNMPFKVASHDKPALTNEEAWDVAAFVNSQPRTHKDQSGDWKDVSTKMLDEPFGPYADDFSERQHKFGPYPPIVLEQKNKTADKKISGKKL